MPLANFFVKVFELNLCFHSAVALVEGVHEPPAHLLLFFFFFSYKPYCMYHICLRYRYSVIKFYCNYLKFQEMGFTGIAYNADLDHAAIFGSALLV